jgi:hypothetical protein
MQPFAREQFCKRGRPAPPDIVFSFDHPEPKRVIHPGPASWALLDSLFRPE